MSISAADQSFIFLCCILCGAFIGILFDLFRIIRRIIPAGNIATLIEDIVFWIITLGIVCYCALIINYGALRWYMFASISVGALLYFLTISRIVIYIAIFIITIVKKILLFILKIILVPIKLIAKIFRKPFFFVINIGKNSFKRIKNKTKFSLTTFVRYFKHLKKYDLTGE